MTTPAQPLFSTATIVLRLRHGLPPGRSEDLLQLTRELRLDDLRSRLRRLGVPGGRRVVTHVSPRELAKRERAQSDSPYPPLRSLTLDWRIEVPAGRSPDEDAAFLQASPDVDVAYPESDVTQPNQPPDPLAPEQTHLFPPAVGVNAEWARSHALVGLADIGLVDLEQDWLVTHQELVGLIDPVPISGDNRSGQQPYNGMHGTAVLGIIAAAHNGLGGMGMATGLREIRVVSHYQVPAAGQTQPAHLHVANAISAATDAMRTGDILVLEVQRQPPKRPTAAPMGAVYPTETDGPDGDAIRAALAKGLIVIEAAGNGNVDLDVQAQLPQGTTSLSGAERDKITDAILVGAGRYFEGGYSRLPSSNYGTGIDCFASGFGVTTCGGANPIDSQAPLTQWYTRAFGQTSSATAIIAGAAALLQGMYVTATGTPLTPRQMRQLLKDPATGTSPIGGAAEGIGVMPDLRAIAEGPLAAVLHL